MSKHHLEHSKLCGQPLKPDQLHKMVQMCNAKHDGCEQHCVCPAEALQSIFRSEASTEVGHIKPDMLSRQRNRMKGVCVSQLNVKS